jgi:hypothetical protein
VTLFAICTMHKETRSAGFLVEPQNQGRWFGLKTTWAICQWFGLKTTGMVCQWFGLKTTGMVSPSLTSKLVVTVSQFGPQNRQLCFGDLSLKINMTVSWFVP